VTKFNLPEINQSTVANIKTIRDLVKLVDSMKTNLVEAEQIGVQTLLESVTLNSAPQDVLEAYTYSGIEIGKNLTAVLEDVGRLAATIEQIHISMSEAKVGVDGLIARQAEAAAQAAATN